ncbi:nucleotide-sugar transporter [Meredithblackwellia eburnea MCA 4105]
MVGKSREKPRVITTELEKPLKLIPIDVEPEPEPWVSRKTIALVALVVQNASVSLLTRLSRVPQPGMHLYNPSTAVFVAELLKVSVSFTMLVRERSNKGRSKKDGKRKTSYLWEARMAVWDLFVNQRKDIIKLCVPAALYALQNTLLYTALSNLDAATYQTTYQLKLLTTALFSVLFFRTPLSLTQWFSLLLLAIGVATVQLEGQKPPQNASERVATNPSIGLAAILAACISSGLAGAWFEYVLKAPPAPPPPSAIPTSPTSPISSISSPPSSPSKSPRSPRLQLRQNSPSLWARNVQLSVPSLCFSFSGVILSPEWNRVGKFGLLEGFTPLVWGVVGNQAVGGLLVAMVVREANSVAKGFATSIAIVVSTLAGVVFLGLVPGFLFVGGASMVIASTILYAMDS